MSGLLFCCLLSLSARATETVLLPEGSTWRYFDATPPPSDWTQPGFDDQTWSAGAAPLGYGVIGVSTEISYGPDPLNRPMAAYFRAEIDIPDTSAYEAYAIGLRRDDGAVVYVNGTEVGRNNLPSGPIDPETPALAAVIGTEQETFFSMVVPSGALTDGRNVIAVEVHQQAPSSTDLVLDAKLSGFSGPVSVVRGPYLQQVTPDGVLVRWVTDGPSEGRLYYREGSLGPYDPLGDASVVEDRVLRFDHALRITGAPPSTEIGYAVGGTSPGYLVGGDAKHVFRTAPVVGKRVPVRVWVLGDSGTASADAEAVRDAYRAFEPDVLGTDVWLMLGDNAYNNGTTEEYDEAVFQFYTDTLRQVALWPALGNHDGYSAFSETQTGPYFELFDLPSQGEAGGLPSGTEAYWSFDYANVHFVCLDSYHSDRSESGAMVSWLAADLASADADFTVVFFHHPPYSKGSHNSDTELEMVEMRELVLPTLEAGGVDLVLTGHSHSYERSFLIDGHYGESTTFDPLTMIRQDHDGDPSGDGPYTKWPEGASPHEGTVYVVAGSSGQISGGALDHPAMLLSASVLGSMVLDIDGLSLTATFLDDAGNAFDTFAIDKGKTTIVSIAGPRVASEGEEIAFIGLARQPDGSEPPVYSFDWGDGSADSAGPIASHTWSLEGSYTATLSVTDDQGIVTSEEFVVQIDNTPPVIEAISASPSPIEGTPVVLSAIASDPSGQPVSYLWEVEGELYEGDIVSHTFFDNGLFEASLEVTDSAGRTTTATLPIDVDNAPPTFSFLSQDGELENEPIEIYAFTYDPGFLDATTVEWTLPDGSTQPGEEISIIVPDDTDIPTIRVRVTDDDGASTEQDVPIEVFNQPPVVLSAGFEGDLFEGSTLTFSASASDPSPLDTASIAWSFDGGVSFTLGSEAVFTFGDQGPYEVLARASDEDGGSSVYPVEVSLQNLPPEILSLAIPQGVPEGLPSPLSLAASDPGFDDVLTATWQFSAGAPAAGLSVAYTPPDDGDWPIIVTLTDDEGDGESVVTSITAVNVAPRFISEPPLRGAPGRIITYTPTIEDVDPFTLTFTGPPGASLEEGTLTFAVPDTVGETYEMLLAADDGEGGISSQSWSFVVDLGPSMPDERFEREDLLTGCACSASRAPHAALISLLALLPLARRRRA